MAATKRICILLLGLLLLLPLGTRAEEGYTALVLDEADLLTEGEEQLLLLDMAALLPYGNALFLTVNQNASSSESLAQSRYLSAFGDTSGVVLLVDMDNRYIYLASHGDARKYLTDARSSAITDKLYTLASKEQYYLFAQKTFEQTAAVLEGGRVTAPLRYVTNALLALCLALAVNFCIVSLQHRKLSPQNALKVKVAVNTASTVATVGAVAAVAATMLHRRKTRHVESSSSGGGHGGGFSGGHSGGGGFSGGGHHF